MLKLLELLDQKTNSNLASTSIVQLINRKKLNEPCKTKNTGYERWKPHAERIVAFALTRRSHQTALLAMFYDVSFRGGLHPWMLSGLIPQGVAARHDTLSDNR